MAESDLELIEKFRRNRSEEAFSELVRRHVGLVYATAVRQVRSPELAEEIVQSVFTDLARNAHKLTSGTIVGAWLYQVTRRTAIDVIRRERRRQLRELAASQHASMNSSSDEQWAHIEFRLDAAMETLDEKDRTAVLLRFFQGKSLQEIGEIMGHSTNAAQKRLSRALDKLRNFLEQNEIKVSSVSLAALLGSNATATVPSSIVTAVSTVALRSALNLSQAEASAFGFMSLNTKAITAAVLSMSLVGTPLFILYKANQRLELDNSRLQNRLIDLERDRNSLAQENERISGSVRLADAQHRELMQLRARVTLDNQQARSTGTTKSSRTDSATAPDSELATKQRGQMEKTAAAIASFIETYPTGKFFTDGQLNPLLTNLETEVDWSEIEIVFNDVGALKRSASIDPSSVVARSRNAFQNATGDWIRWYTFADGDVKPRLHASDQEMIVPFVLANE